MGIRDRPILAPTCGIRDHRGGYIVQQARLKMCDQRLRQVRRLRQAQYAEQVVAGERFAVLRDLVHEGFGDSAQPGNAFRAGKSPQGAEQFGARIEPEATEAFLQAIGHPPECTRRAFRLRWDDIPCLLYTSRCV